MFENENVGEKKYSINSDIIKFYWANGASRFSVHFLRRISFKFKPSSCYRNHIHSKKTKKSKGCLFYCFNFGKKYLLGKKIRQLNAKKAKKVSHNVLCIKISHRRDRLFVLYSFRCFLQSKQNKKNRLFFRWWNVFVQSNVLFYL